AGATESGLFSFDLPIHLAHNKVGARFSSKGHLWPKNGSRKQVD
ncbi:MAG: hypothetical protein ACI8YI_000672, partial [Paracoccaceae bacterium]